MPILGIDRDSGISVNIVRILTNDTLAASTANGYLTAQLPVTTALNSGVFEWLSIDMIALFASDGSGIFQISPDASTISPVASIGNGAVTLPVVSGNFAVFSGTLGGLDDVGYTPSNPALPFVVMSPGTLLPNHIAVFADANGTLKQDGTPAINNGEIQSGSPGVAGGISIFPTTFGRGSLVINAANNANNYLTQIINAPQGQATDYVIPDAGVSATFFITADSASTQTINTGNLALTAGYLRASNVNGLTALAGGGQAGATPLTAQLNRFTTVAANGDSGLLPVSVAGTFVVVANSDASGNSLNIYGQVGDIINNQAVNTPLSIPGTNSAMFFCILAGTWNSILTA